MACMAFSKSAWTIVCAASLLNTAPVPAANAPGELSSGRPAVASASSRIAAPAPPAAAAAAAGGLSSAPDVAGTKAIDNELTPRKPLPKQNLTSVPQSATGTIILKLADDVPAYALAETGRVHALVEDERIDVVNTIVAQYGMKVAPWIKASAERMSALEFKAAARSGKMQPRLANILTLSGPGEGLLGCARALNDLESVEWVEFEMTRDMGGGVVTGACCAGAPAVCTPGLTELDCAMLPGVFQGADTACTSSCAACCVAEDCFEPYTAEGCLEIGGNYAPGESCADEDFECEEGCGVVNPPQGDCFAFEGNGTPFCEIEACCESVCECDPFCCREDEDEIGFWDHLCAAEAGVLCGNDISPCGSPAAGSCFEPHPAPGCSFLSCCDSVCAENPFCCEVSWEAACADAAVALCGQPLSSPLGGFVTPDFTGYQGYLTCGGYLESLPGLGGACPAANFPNSAFLESYFRFVFGLPFIGFSGQGWALGDPGEPFTDTNGNGFRDPGELWQDFNGDGLYGRPGGGECFTDTNGNGWFDPGEPMPCDDGDDVWNGPFGLRGLAEELKFKFDIDQLGQGNLTTGRGAKAIVIEWGCYPEHEDLDITVEPGQTLLDFSVDFISADHGTACASIIGAKNNGFGVTGIAPDLDELLFYPLTSLEEGPRESAAWFNAIEYLDPGDVISASYGPGGPPYCLNNEGPMWTLFRIASDLGIHVCVAAGNNGQNMDAVADLGDSGAIVVGACSPGFPWYRLGFSNYATESTFARSNNPHVRAWGDFVAAAGYGDLQSVASPLPGLPDDVNRRYTFGFSGTSSAAPQIAGLVVCLQGFSKMFYGFPLGVEVMRGAIAQSGGWPVDELLPPPPDGDGRISRDLFIGQLGGPDCPWDLVPDAEVNWIGAYPSTFGAIDTILTQGFAGFDDAPTVDDVIIVRGDHIAGNVFALKRAGDNVRLIVESVFTERDQGLAGPLTGEGPSGSNPAVLYPQIGEVSYLGSGQITDVVVVGHNIAQIPTNFALQYQPMNVTVGTMVFLDAYDWQLQRWSFVGFQYLAPGGGGGIFVFPAGDATRFISDTPGEIMLGRVWTLGFTLSGGFSGPSGQAGRIEYLTGMDYFNFLIGDQLGEGP